MASPDTLVTSTTAYPVFASKATFLDAYEQAVESGRCNVAQLREILYRLSNTDTSTWGDPTAKHTD